MRSSLVASPDLATAQSSFCLINSHLTRGPSWPCLPEQRIGLIVSDCGNQEGTGGKGGGGGETCSEEKQLASAKGLSGV